MVGINALSGTVTFTPPSGDGPWTQIDASTADSNYVQSYYWHKLTSTDIINGSFTFGLSASSTATLVVAVYTNTCLDSVTPCINPVTTSNSMTGTSGAISAGSIGDGITTVPYNSASVAMFGHQSHGVPVPTAPADLTLENGDGTNSGLGISDELENTAGSYPTTVGPFTGTNVGNGSWVGEVANIAGANPF